MRIRTIKPDFWLHEGMAKLPEFTRLLAIALLNYADDEGYFMASPALIRGQLFPFLESSKMIPGSIQDLSREGYLTISESEDGRLLGKIVNFDKHQRVDKPKPSSIKDLWQFQDASKTHPRRIQDASKEEGKGREKEKEVERERKGKGTLAELREFALEIEMPESDGDACFYGWEANGWTISGKRMKDWKSAMRNWKSRGYLASQKTGFCRGAKPVRTLESYEPTAQTDENGEVKF